MSEPAILHHAFDLLCAFDEVVSLGYKENVSLSQVRNVLEGESHEEKIQEIIARNKEAEAKEELKRRAKQLEMQRREQQKRAQAGMGGGGMGNGMGSMGMAGGYQPAPRFEAPAQEYRAPSPAPAAAKPAFKGSGMKLGGKKGRQADVLNALGADVDMEPEAPPAPEPEAEPETQVSADVLEKVDQEPYVSLCVVQSTADLVRIHVTVKEQLSVTLLRDGGVQAFELKGDLDLRVTEASLAKLRLTLAPKDYSELQFKQHPNVAKFTGNEKIIALKDPSRSFPVGQGLGVLRWRMTAKDESKVPLSGQFQPRLTGVYAELLQSPSGLNHAAMAARTLRSNTSSKPHISLFATSLSPYPSLPTRSLRSMGMPIGVLTAVRSSGQSTLSTRTTPAARSSSSARVTPMPFSLCRLGSWLRARWAMWTWSRRQRRMGRTSLSARRKY